MRSEPEPGLAQALEQASDLEAIVNHSGSVVMLWSAMPGYPIEYVTRNVDQWGHDASQLMAGATNWSDRLHPDDAGDFEERLGSFLAANLDAYVFDYRMFDCRNRVRWVADRTHAFRDANGQIAGYVSIISDISERRQREIELQLLAATAAALGQAATSAAAQDILLHAVCQALAIDTAAIGSTDPDGRTLAVDCGCGDWAHLAGVTRSLDEGIVGLVAATRQPFVSNDLASEPLMAQPHLVSNTQAAVCVPLIVGGRVIGILAGGRPTPFDSGDVRLLATLADMAAGALDRINLLETLEQRVAQRTQDLLAANLRLQQLARHKDEFLATMSHELRTPLTAVLGLSEALDAGVYGKPNERQQRALQVILQSGRHLLNQINELLDFSRIEAGYIELQPEPCSLAMVCQSCLALVAEMVKSKRQEVRLDAPQSVMLLADTRRLHQLLLNLLSNASKFTPEGGVIVLRVHADPAAATVVIEVADTGIGIAPADQTRIFEPFVQLDSSLSRQYAGSGLGLALVQRIAGLHGGSVAVFSQLGEGSRFVVTLPWRRPS